MSRLQVDKVLNSNVPLEDSTGSSLHDSATNVLLSMISKESMEEILSQDLCEIEPDFLGFVGNYYLLSMMIPKNFTIVDLGCAYAPQSYLFQQHNKYIGVDNGTVKRFTSANTEHKSCTIKSFLESKEFSVLDLNTTFFICQYVPSWYEHDIKKVLGKLKNVFSFYPCGD